MREVNRITNDSTNELAQQSRLIAELAVKENERKRAEERLSESEKKYKHLFEELNDAAILADMNTGIILEVNRVSEELLGRARDEIIGMHQTHIHPPELAEEYHWRFKQHVEKGHIADYDGEVIRKDGSIVPVSISAAPVHIAGRPLILGLFRDITERKRAEEKFRESEEFTKSILHSAPNPVMVLNPDTSIRYVNPALEKLTGYPADEVIGLKTPHPWLVEGEPRETRDSMIKKIAAGKTSDELCLQKKNGERFYVEASVAYIEREGKLAYSLLNWVDITERKKAEEALRDSEKRYRELVDLLPQTVFEIDDTGRLLFTNRRGFELTGYTRQDIRDGFNVMQLFAPEDMERVRENMGRVFNGEWLGGNEYTLVAKDGGTCPVLVYSVPVTRGDNTSSLVGVVIDISDWKRAEELTRTVANSSPIGVHIIQDGRCQFVNTRFQEFTGYSEEELLDMAPLSIVHPEDVEKVRQYTSDMLSGKRSAPYEFRGINSQGETRWTIGTVASIHYRGSPAILGNFMDITEYKQAEEREKQLQQELALSNRLASIGELAAGVAHELNNPLTAVLGYSQRLMRLTFGEDIQKSLGRIHEQAKRAVKVVENLMTFARRREARKEPVDVNDIIRKTLELRAYELKTSNIEVVTILEEGLPKIMADDQHIEQVLLNIILNAEQAMTETRNAGRLVIKTQQGRRHIRISIADDGPGIPPEALDKLFDPFFTTRGDNGGTGLGLSICHGIIKEHGGEIYARSRPGKGATFHVRLPFTTEE